MAARRGRDDGSGGSPLAPDGVALLRELEGRIKRLPTRPLYRMGLLLVALAMVLLPAIYLGLAVGTAVGTYHAAKAIATGAAWKHQGSVTLGVAVVGSIVVLFLFKPLLARAGRQGARGPVSLSPAREPLLYAFVERLSALVGSPVPSRIDVDTEPNASASPRRGVVSILAKDLVLTIGLPLAGALDLRALAGVLAHELGHFAQGGGMGLTYVIRSINAWFARVCHERDRWDERLVALSEVGDWFSLVGLCARACVGLSRGILRALMYAGHGISCFALRQMEYDADRYEAIVAGGDCFESTQARLPELGLAAHVAWGELGATYREGRLVDDVPGLILARERSIPDDVRKELSHAAVTARTRFFDTHPSATDRVAATRRLGARGIFRDPRPARALFSDFEALSRAATKQVYLERGGPHAGKVALVPVSALIQEGESDAAARAAFGRIVGQTFHPSVPLLHREADGALAPAGDRDTAVKHVAEAFDRVVTVARAISCTDGGRWHLARGVGSPPPLPPQLRQSFKRANQALRQARERAGVPFAEARRRLASAPGGRLLDAARAIERAWPLVETLTVRIQCLEELAPYAGEAAEDNKLRLQIKKMTDSIGKAHATVADALAEVPHPFLDEKLGAHAIVAADGPDPDATLAAAQSTVEALATLRMRSLAHVALAAERADAPPAGGAAPGTP